LGDLTVRRAFGGKFGDAPLAGCERLDAAQGDPSWPSAGGAKLGLGAGDERRGTAERRHLERLAELLADLRSPQQAPDM
jgi:hypothetical protein